MTCMPSAGRSTATCIRPSPTSRRLLPYLDRFWRDSVDGRGIASLESQQLSAERADQRAARLRATAAGWPRPIREACAIRCFDRWQAGIAICNCLYGVQLPFNEDMARAPSRARSTTGSRKEWLDRDPRLRASIVIAAAECRIRGRRDRALRRGPALRAGAGARHGRGAARATAILADLSPPPNVTACRSASMPAAPIGIRSRRSGWPSYYLEDYASPVAGLPVAARLAWSARACSRNSRN